MLVVDALALGAEHFAGHPVSADLQHQLEAPPVQLGLPLSRRRDRARPCPSAARVVMC
jgi:hypothetical protein